MSPISDAEVDAWLEAFADCVRSRDLERGRVLFSPDAAGFGTLAERYDGLDALVSDQWAPVWGRTEEFVFDDVATPWSDATLCAVATTWHSVASDEAQRRTRTGRATLVLRRSESGPLVAVHSHFSMTPGTAA